MTIRKYVGNWVKKVKQLSKNNKFIETDNMVITLLKGKGVGRGRKR